MNEREGEIKRKAKEKQKAIEEDFGDDIKGRVRYGKLSAEVSSTA